MKYFTALTIACFSLMNAHAFEPFANISVGNVSPDNLDASVSGFGAAAVPGTFELDGKESIKLEIGLKDDSGLSVGIHYLTETSCIQCRKLSMRITVFSVASVRQVWL